MQTIFSFLGSLNPLLIYSCFALCGFIAAGYSLATMDIQERENGGRLKKADYQLQNLITIFLVFIPPFGLALILYIFTMSVITCIAPSLQKDREKRYAKISEWRFPIKVC